MSDNQKPALLKLEPGDYFWCTCSKSATQPFCDGSHRGTGASPLKFTVTETKTLALCNCKRTNNPPFCDGSHSSD
ncbi:MAG: CDGSH iron-sulfur domain-containing protein [Verrucomicrobiales bacterium]|nr:CDGSH iron-sulfur domain-containing protein [Verrucomicrobiales bacterium]